MEAVENKAAESLAHHFCLVIDNDYDSYQERRRMVREAMESETPRADLADALKDWAERMLDLEDDGNMLRTELLTTALEWIDWHSMAVDYLEEEAEQS